MITQSTKMSLNSLYPLSTKMRIKEDVVKKVDDDDQNVKGKSDVIEISEDGKVSHEVYDFLDKGKSNPDIVFKSANNDNPNTLSEEAKKEDANSTKPYYGNVNKLRYEQLKSEIEKNFAEAPDEKSKYLKLLDNVYRDYKNLQEVISESELKVDKDTGDGQIESNTVGDKTNKQLEEKKATIDEEEKKKAYKKEEEVRERRTSDEAEMTRKNVSYEEKMMIVKKAFGNEENKYPKVISDEVDKFFIDALKK